MFSFCRKVLFFSLIFLLISSFAFSAELSSNEKKALSYIRELCFEVTCYNIAGLSSMPESVGLAEISETGSRLLAQRKSFGSPRNSVYFFEYYTPEKIGIIDSTFCPEDLYVISEEEFYEENLDSIENLEELTETHLPEETVESGEAGETSVKTQKFDWIDLLLQNLDSYSVPPASEVFDVQDGSKILEMLENNDSRGIDGLEDSKVSEKLPQEFSYIQSNGDLRRFSYDGEQFTMWKYGDDTILVNFYGTKLIRKKFDSLYRLVKSEQFKTSNSAQQTSLETQLDYEYSGDSSSPSKSIEQLFSQKKKLVNKFDESGRKIYILESHYEEREIKSSKKKKAENVESEKTDSEKADKTEEKPKTETVLLDDKKTSRKYDEKGRIIEEETVTWTYKQGISGRYSRHERSVKNVFDYSAVTDENNFPPNLKFYENGELHMERNYSASNSYSEKLYFEDGFSVELIYESGVKKSEIIYVNGKEQRRREFEY